MNAPKEEPCPVVDERQGRAWILDRYDHIGMPPGIAEAALGKGDRPWEKEQAKRDRLKLKLTR